MDRLLLCVLVCAGVARGAPQEPEAAFVASQPPGTTERGAAPASTARLPLDDQYDDATDAPGSAVTATEAEPPAPPSETEPETEGPFSPATEAGRETERPTSPSEGETERQTERAPPPRSSVRTFTRAPRPPRPGPRFLAKLSSYKASSGGAAGNLLQSPGKEPPRRFKSRCRCERIWNCPKLQITVPRCPDEYFLCCF